MTCGDYSHIRRKGEQLPHDMRRIQGANGTADVSAVKPDIVVHTTATDIRAGGLTDLFGRCYLPETVLRLTLNLYLQHESPAGWVQHPTGMPNAWSGQTV
jgi:hypothetical protein